MKMMSDILIIPVIYDGPVDMHMAIYLKGMIYISVI